MALTGGAVRQGNTDYFGVGRSIGATPRSFVSFNGEPYVIAREALIHITDLENGSGVLIQNSSDYGLSSSDPTCGFVYNSRLYFLDRSEDVLVIFNDPLNGDVGIIDFYSNIISPSAAATDTTTVWIFDSSDDTLHTIDPSDAATTEIGVVTFDVTSPSNNITGAFYYDGTLYLLDNGTELLFAIDDLDVSSLMASAVDSSISEFGAAQRGVNGGDNHLGEVYMAGGNPDALYRFYNVRWDETIDTIEVSAGGSTTQDLHTISKDASSFEFTPGDTAPSWLTIAGNDLVITNAPSVTADTDFSQNVRAVRGSKHEDTTLTVRVLATAAPPTIVVPGASTSLALTETHNSIVATWAAAANNGGESPTRYDVRINNGNWIDAGLDLTHTFENLSPNTEYLIEVVQVNSAGRGTIASERITTDTTVSGAPTDLQVVPASTTAAVLWQAPSNTGGTEIIGSEVRVAEGATIPTDTPWQTFTADDSTNGILTGLEKNTNYAVEVRLLNSVGQSLSSGVTTFTTLRLMAPVWQTGTALKRTIYAGETATVDIGALVTDADDIEEIFGLQFHWMEYNESTKILTLKDAPIVREDTEIRIRFLASNDDGKTPENYIVTLKGSVLASLHNSLFFEEPLNYEPESGRVKRRGTSTIVKELTDNDYTTFSTHTDFTINMADANGTPTGFDYIFIKAKGRNIRYSIAPTGGTGQGFTNRLIPETIKNIGGGEVSTIVNGFIHDLYPLPQRVTATSVRLQINGTNLEIYAVMLLKLGWELDANSDFIQMQFEKVDRAGRLSEKPDGEIERVQVLGAERFKWEAQYTAIVEGSDVDEWMDWTEANINCGFAREFSRHPEDVYPSFFPTFEMPNGYLGLVKSVGETIQFGVAEQ